MSARNTLIDMSKVTHDDIVYLAGLIDGDGSIHISPRIIRDGRQSRSYGMNLSIHCIEKSLIDWVFDVFGGVRCQLNKKPPRRSLYGVQITGNRLTQLIELLLPYLKLKRPHAINMLEIRKTYDGIGGRKPVPPEVEEIRFRCLLKARELNSHKTIPKD